MFRKHDVDAVFAGQHHDNAAGEYKGIPSVTTTSIAVQIGDSRPSIRVITVKDGNVSTELIPLD